MTPRLSVRLLALAAISTSLFSLSVRASVDDYLDIGVRSTIASPPKTSKASATLTPATAPTGQTFKLFPAQLVPSLDKLAKPFSPDDVNAMLTCLGRELVSRGFQVAPAGQKPDLLITCQYGRAYLRNPYLDAFVSTYDTLSSDLPTATITGLSTMRRIENGVEAKLQKANGEKLFITISAWDYASMKTPKARLVWSTVMNVDDPDRRDLRQIYQQMLATGSAYFNRATKDEEADIAVPLRDGNVKLGTPTVVDEAKPAAPR